MPWSPQGPYSAGGPFSSGNANNMEAGISGAYTELESITGNDGVTQATTDGPFTLANFINYILKAIRNITGSANWYDTPATTIASLNTNKLNASSYTASDVLAKIKTVDGSGSGLDADTLDGKDSTAFVQLDAANEAATPVKIIITDTLPAAGTKGRLCFVTPFAMP